MGMSIPPSCTYTLWAPLFWLSWRVKVSPSEAGLTEMPKGVGLIHSRSQAMLARYDHRDKPCPISLLTSPLPWCNMGPGGHISTWGCRR